MSTLTIPPHPAVQYDGDRSTVTVEVTVTGRCSHGHTITRPVLVDDDLAHVTGVVEAWAAEHADTCPAATAAVA
ncbi:hypothetical protein U9R90_05240 [Streptomyces sp. E11-3]|uniref:hypothetical protein n=1 Tax=Streptomyces sp. E11-3 TaxID=3110112 RepID=UPI0039805491